MLQILHLCTQISVCATNFGPFGENGATFSVQLSWRSQFANFVNKKVIAKTQCEKHKKLEFNCLLNQIKKGKECTRQADKGRKVHSA